MKKIDSLALPLSTLTKNGLRSRAAGVAAPARDCRALSLRRRHPLSADVQGRYGYAAATSAADPCRRNFATSSASFSAWSRRPSEVAVLCSTSAALRFVI